MLRVGEPDSRDRVLDAAVALTTEQGWARVTMTALAERAGVSRQTVYNSVGTRDRLAAAMIERELERFLEIVEAGFAAHPGDLLAAVGLVVRSVLEHAQGNALLRAVASAHHGADTELLPLLATEGSPLLPAAAAVVAKHVASYHLPLEEHRRELVVEAMVRLVLSHVLQPVRTPEKTAEDVTWLAGRLLSGS